MMAKTKIGLNNLSKIFVNFIKGIDRAFSVITEDYCGVSASIFFKS